MERVSARPRHTDAAIGLALFALAQAESWLGSATDGQRVETALAATVIAPPLALRRSRPMTSLLLVMAGVVGLAITAGLPNVVFLMPAGVLAVYSVGAHMPSDRALIGLAVSLVAVAGTAWRTDEASVTDLTAPAILFSASWAVGRSIRKRRADTSRLEQKATRLEREQAEREAAAAAEERQRIARELHDIVAHRVSAIVVQSESGLAVADEPERARETFAAIGSSGRQALDDLRRLLGLLRDGDEASGTSPQPSLVRLDEIVRDVRGAGLPVEARVEGKLDGLSPSVDVAAYRIVQEALTNALRHARTDTTVVVRRDTAGLTVSVRNPLPAEAPPGSDAGTGSGLAGMRERVRVYGGTLEAGRENGEFVVRAHLPIAGIGP